MGIDRSCFRSPNRYCRCGFDSLMRQQKNPHGDPFGENRIMD
jgi:hypothetical protein